MINMGVYFFQVLYSLYDTIHAFTLHLRLTRVQILPQVTKIHIQQHRPMVQGPLHPQINLISATRYLIPIQ